MRADNPPGPGKQKSAVSPARPRREIIERRIKARVANIPNNVHLVDELLADRRAALNRELV
ncbi:hypothetical protein RM531_05350 [Salinisphaera sp. P385]|uniref:Uncharacterized protein n=1 Tax=Spectribacter acetivorans TaxID=3075603 RepID=A0ABU3B611_9GAMM|nr:hypothetical protein [Salinisphaera sp. P385]MDT0617889.1 hypothetical protein [Salinisphaera sp. P385]